jgi:hypothetical protein
VLEREKRQLYLAAETAREVGILVAVFAPLDAFFHDKPPEAWKVLALVLWALTTILCAIRIESEREH